MTSSLQTDSSKNLRLHEFIIQFMTASAGSDQWTLECNASARLERNPSKRSYFIQIYDLKTQKIVLEQDLCKLSEYNVQSSVFHAFALADRKVGLNFFDGTEATQFAAVVREKLASRKVKLRLKQGDQQKSEFLSFLQSLSHSYDIVQGSSRLEVSDLISLTRKAGVTRAQQKDVEMIMLISKFFDDQFEKKADGGSASPLTTDSANSSSDDHHDEARAVLRKQFCIEPTEASQRGSITSTVYPPIPSSPTISQILLLMQSIKESFPVTAPPPFGPPPPPPFGAPPPPPPPFGTSGRSATKKPENTNTKKKSTHTTQQGAYADLQALINQQIRAGVKLRKVKPIAKKSPEELACNDASLATALKSRFKAIHPKSEENDTESKNASDDEWKE